MRQWRHASRRARAAGAFALALSACGLAAAPARAADVTMEGETMTPAESSAGPEADPQASGGSALRVPADGSAEGTVGVPQSTTQLFVRARGNNCGGPPTVSLSIDGVERVTGPVSTEGYGDLGARLSIPAGQHTVSVAVTYGSFGLLCDRSAWIDSVTIVGQPFSPTGWRNARLSQRAPIAEDSAALVAELRSQIKSRPQGALIGTTQYSSPVYVVPRDQPTVRVQAPADRPDLQRQWAAVPLPPDARPAPGSDGHLVVWQPSTDTMWEFWVLTKDLGLPRWRARFGGRMSHVSESEGHFSSRFGATATSISLLAGTQRIEELRRGVIDHAVDFAVLRTGARNGWCWPAQRTDRQLPRGTGRGIPAGTRFRLPARFDLAAYAREHPLSRYALTVARAVQRHGMVVRDTSSEVGFFAEDPAPLGWDPYAEIFEGQAANSRGTLRNFPWRRLQVVAPPAGTACVDRSR